MDHFLLLFGHLREWCLSHPQTLGEDYLIVLFVVMLAALLGGKRKYD